MTTASAPGKIILFGEHAVVYGRPALAVPVTQVQAVVRVEPGTRPGFWVEAPDVHLSAELSSLAPNHPLRAAINLVLSMFGLGSPPACRLHITSTIPIASGLGSGTAVSVAIIRALSAFLGQPFPDEQVNALAFEVEKLHHGTPSGIDNTVVTYTRPVFFVRGQPLETFSVGAPLTLVIGDSGLPAPTRDSVAAVRLLWESDRPRWEQVFDRIGELARGARRLIEDGGDLPGLGAVMDLNHALLQELTVSCPELDRLVDAARLAGALGAKLSGGGRGGNMLALVQDANAPAVAGALKAAGAMQVLTTRLG
jgi:mevalonate kinase